jgi:hypothetical protein
MSELVDIDLGGGIVVRGQREVSPTSDYAQEITADDFAAYVEDAAPPEARPENTLAAITVAARDLRAAQAHVKACEDSLKAAQGVVRTLEESTLPGLMDEAQQLELTTLDGWKLKRTSIMRASIPEANMPQAVMWLKANGAASIVKKKVTMEFGRGEEQRAAEVRDLLLGSGFVPSEKESVHPMTLAATLTEMIEQGKNVPLDIMGAYNQARVTMKPVKK